MTSAAGAGARLLRHGALARWTHGMAAAAIALLLASGLALGEVLPPTWVHAMGGHERVNALHNGAGVAFVLAAALLIVVRWRCALALLRELARVRWADLAWMAAFARDLMHPGAPPRAFHGDRLDPLQRWVLAIVLAMAAVAGVSGVGLYALPDAPRWALALMIRAHVWSAWLLLAALAPHVFAGLGALPSHRGIARSMFGDGTVDVRTARRLWPGWAGARETGHPSR